MNTKQISETILKNHSKKEAGLNKNFSVIVSNKETEKNGYTEKVKKIKIVEPKTAKENLFKATGINTDETLKTLKENNTFNGGIVYTGALNFIYNKLRKVNKGIYKE
jgi:hypothetical protein